MFSSQKRKIYLQMLKGVAEANWPDYLDEVVFVGGCYRQCKNDPLTAI